MPVGNQDVDINAYDANGELINRNQADIYFNQPANTVSVLAVRTVVIQQTIVIKPTQTSANIVNPPVPSLIGAVTATQASANPIALGSANLGSGNVTYTKTYFAGSLAVGGIGGIGTSNNPRTHTVNISLPASTSVGLGTGNTTVEIISTIYTPYKPGTGGIVPTPARAASTSVTTRTFILAEGQLAASTVYSLGLPDVITTNNGFGSTSTVDYTLQLTALSIRVLKATAQGDVVIANQALSVGEVATVSQLLSVPQKLYLKGQPPATAKVFVSYRAAGSTGAYTTALAPLLINAAGVAMADNFAFDYSAVAAGNYEYQYVALDASGTLLNQQSGTFNTATGVASAQTPIAAGGIGRAMLEGSNLTLVNQGSNVASVTMRYRVAGSNNWLTLPSFTKGTASAGIGLDSFSLANANLSGLANATTYELDFEAYDTSGQLLRVVSNQLIKDASGGMSISALAVSKIRISGQPANTAYLDIATRAVGSLGAYTALTRVYPNNLGKFDLSILGISVGDKDVDMLAYDTNGVLVNHNQANIYFNQAQNIVTVNDLRAIDMQLPVQTNADYVIVGYRLTGTFNGYTMLPAQQLTIKNGVKQARINLPVTLAAGTYEYQYTAYLPDVLGTNPDDPLDTNYYVATPIGSSNGNFVIGTGTTANARLDWVLGTSTNQASIQRRQSYNAFGEVVTEKDGRGNLTSLTYNTLGKLSQKIEASASITLDNGTKQTITPVTTYTYDAAGRMVATIDANNNINTQAWIKGGAGEQTAFEKHADGGFIKRSFDIFGNKVRETDRINSLTDAGGRTSQFAYDSVNRLTQITRPTGVTDKYTYDAAGQRITHTNALNDTEKTYYDSLGRVTQTKTNMGFATTYTYTFNNNITGIGGAATSGWVNTTTDTVGRTTIDKTDMFKHTVEHKDIGNHTTTYSYNFAGRLTTQTSTTGQNISYDHYANGYIKSIHDKTLGMFTYYEYDADGNKRYEGYVALKDKNDITKGFSEFYQQATITYDALNRMTKVEDPKAMIEYQYDAVGNRRSVKSTYYEVGGASKVQEYWYKYDNVNRFLITMGTLNNGAITKGALGSAGVDIIYNAAGERMFATNAINGNIEAYTYNADGYLTDVNINGVLRSRRTNDALGRVTNLTEYSNGTTVSYAMTTAYDKDNRTLTQVDNTGSKTWYDYYYDTADSTGVYNHYSSGGAGELAHTFSDSDGNGNRADGTIVDSNYGYEYWDEAKMSSITADPYNKAIKKSNNKWANGYSDITYDVNGHINGAVDRVGKRNFRYVSDAQGLILFRDEITGTIDRPNYRYYASTYNAGSIANKVQRYYYVDGKVVGDVGNDGPSRTDYVTAMANRGSQKGNYANWTPVASADFDQNYEPISPTNPGPVASSYTVKNGDTLQSIASTVWGDSSMWYLLADANGLSSGQALKANMVLTIPNKITNIHNTSGTFRPYNPGEAIGDLNPTIPAMPKPPKKKGCGGFFAIIAAVVAVAVTAITGNPVLGNLAGQLVGIATGAQKGFNFNSFALSFVNIAPFNAGAPGLQGVLNAAGNAAVNNVASQGLNIITGQQKGFSWSSVAASAVGGAVGNGIGSKVDSVVRNNGFGSFAGLAGLTTTGNFISGAVTGVASSLASQITQIALDGRGKLSWVAVASAGLSNGVGRAVGAYKAEQAVNDVQIAKAKQTPVAGIRLANSDMPKSWDGIGIVPELRERMDYSTPSTNFTAEDFKNINLNAVIGSADLVQNPNGLNMSWWETSTSQDDYNAVRNGGLRVSTRGIPADIKTDVVKEKFEARNSVGKIYSDSVGTSYLSSLEKSTGYPEGALMEVYGTKIFHGRDFRTHQNVGAVILGGYFTEKQISNINIGHVNIDADQYQTEKYSYMHAMSGRNIDGTPQTPAQARIAANNFVREQFNLAWKYQDLGRDDLAMQHFGFALHTLQDSTSPEHNGFQKWTVYTSSQDASYFSKSISYVLNQKIEIPHGLGEAFNPDYLNSNFAHATLTAVGIYLSREMPKGDLFVYKADQRNDKYQNPYNNLNLSIDNLRQTSVDC